MSDPDDDYLSEKYLIEAPSSAPKTYAQRRKEAEKRSQLNNERNRVNGRRQRELEAREKGLSTSLFERAKDGEDAGIGPTGNKALSIMMKMGFQPGQTLGKADDEEPIAIASSPPVDASLQPPKSAFKSGPSLNTNALREPLPLNEWTGKVGIGVRKRPPSPTFTERVAKMAKMADDASHEAFRGRTRQDYEERRAEGRLVSAQRTCAALDEKAGKSFNVLVLNPNATESFPEGLMDALTNYSSTPLQLHGDTRAAVLESRLRQQMKADTLEPLSSENNDKPSKTSPPKCEWSSDVLQEALQFLRLNARHRLHFLLTYLREKYAYCFWCGMQYGGRDDLDVHCPGEDEGAHD